MGKKNKLSDAELLYQRNKIAEINGMNVDSAMLAFVIDGHDTIVTYRFVTCIVDEDGVLILRDRCNKVVFEANFSTIKAFNFDLPSGDDRSCIVHGANYMKAYADKIEKEWESARIKMENDDRQRELENKRFLQNVERIKQAGVHGFAKDNMIVGKKRVTSYIDKQTGQVVDLEKHPDNTIKLDAVEDVIGKIDATKEYRPSDALDITKPENTCANAQTFDDLDKHKGMLPTCPNAGCGAELQHDGSYTCNECATIIEAKEVVWKDVFDVHEPKMLGHSLDTKDGDNVFTASKAAKEKKP